MTSWKTCASIFALHFKKRSPLNKFTCFITPTRFHFKICIWQCRTFWKWRPLLHLTLTSRCRRNPWQAQDERGPPVSRTSQGNPIHCFESKWQHNDRTCAKLPRRGHVSRAKVVSPTNRVDSESFGSRKCSLQLSTGAANAGSSGSDGTETECPGNCEAASGSTVCVSHSGWLRGPGYTAAAAPQIPSG